VQTPQAEFDSLVDDVWLDLNAGRLEDAVAYFEGGGKHVDVAPGTSVDQDFTLPLCRELNQIDGVTVQALLFDDDTSSFASSLLVALPSNSSSRSEIEKIINSTDENYSGTIDQEWGNKWLSITFDLEE